MPPQIVCVAGIGSVPVDRLKPFLAVLARLSSIPAAPSQKAVRERLRDAYPDFT